jgi:hypothetical protein
MIHPVDIAVRAYVPSQDEVPFKPYQKAMRTFDRVLIFDTETTIDQLQTLKFGSFKIYQYGKLAHEGFFFKPGSLRWIEKEGLAAYCKKRDLKLMTDREFVDGIFFPEVYDLETLCVGFNLPLDLSRLALSFGNARNGMRGGFSFKLTEDKKRPRLTIKHLDSAKSFIRFTNSIDEYKRKKSFKGNFLDLHTLVHALTGESHSLKSASKLFGAAQLKGTAKEHGKVTADYIDYNRQDVDATCALLQRLEEEFDLYALEIPVTKAYSPASIGKEYLRMMGVKPFAEKNHGRISNGLLGYVTSTYFGGRSEVKIRKAPTQVTVLDFLSMYPSMCILLGLWDFITCDHIKQEKYTEAAKDLVEAVTLTDLKDKALWNRLNVIVLVKADGDMLPVRARFDGKQAYNIGDCYISADKPVWYTLADVINSKIRTGKTPEIIRALRFVPAGRQGGLEPIMLFGKKVDARKYNFFKVVIEQRRVVQQLQKQCNDENQKALLDKKQKALKLIANATSYGIFMEINTEDRQADVTAHGLESISCRVSKIETLGPQYNPFVATFITSAARLILGAVEAILAKHGAVHAFCDTDSMAVPPSYAKEIQDFFNGLNPYNFDAPLFKVEQENVMFYGISAKRYVLFKRDNAGNIEVLKASSHGLGHLLNPSSQDKDAKDWHTEVWLDLLHLHYGEVTPEALTEKYGRSFALSKLAISGPQIMKRFGHLNRGKPDDLQIKPFNFCIVGIGSDVDPDTGKPVKPVAPYRKNAQQCPYDTFTDYESGKEMKGLQYWKRFDDVFWSYVNHPEAKFDGDIGVLKRKQVNVRSVTHIGKESNNLEQAEVLGVHESDYVLYGKDAEHLRPYTDKILLAEPKDVRRFGITQRTLYNVKQAIIKGNWRAMSQRTVQRLLAFVTV